MKIALDAMGGDFAPQELVRGAIEAVKSLGVEVVLTGDKERLEYELEKSGAPSQGLEIAHASQVVPMDEHHPAESLRHYRDSSVMVASDLVARNGASAMVSAGNTGAAFASALLRIKRIPGIERPAIGTVFPTVDGCCFLIDAGANVDCRPHHLVSFAIMGSIYMNKVMGIDHPRVAILNNGEEEGKGNQLTREARELIAATSLNFIGNIEGKDIPHGGADVIVTDGFTGNIVLKLAEGLGTAIVAMIKDGIETTGLRGKAGGLLLLPVLKGIKRKMDYSEYGGAVLLGLNNVVVIAHGRSNARAIKNSIRVARDSVEAQIIEKIRDGLSEIKEAE
ncbi:MAG TPA: phosphate acyltransferase PlsX [Firmicutes bacterium]|nr:phosphate acyltransferase PlsX [Bacillota bacterium]HHY98873.1 phosphate acyltransferase PlsX [Bacillota bacterium]